MSEFKLAGARGADICLLFFGVAFAVFCQINSSAELGEKFDRAVFARMVLSMIAIPVALLMLRRTMRNIVKGLSIPEDVVAMYRRYDSSVYALFLLPGICLLGVPFTPGIALTGFLLFIALHHLLVFILLVRSRGGMAFASMGIPPLAFHISGFCALVYQVVWQRVLFTAFGVNIDSITIVVAIFMFGLGLGSLLGGILCRFFPTRLPHLFMTGEMLIGLFGIVSIPLIKTVGQLSVNGSLAATAMAVAALLFFPTLLMGATLPVLATYLHSHYRTVGRTVGVLYFINTMGAAIACFLTADVFFAHYGKQATVLFAVAGNFLIGFLVYRHTRSAVAGTEPALKAADDSSADETDGGLPFAVILALACMTGYISLSQEILWFRALSYATAGKPVIFAHILGFFLLGIAFGSMFGKRVCARGKDFILTFIAIMLMISAVIFYAALPLIGRLLTYSDFHGIRASYLLVTVIAFISGGIFPVLCHRGVTGKRSVGHSLSWVYFANIVGSTAGPLVTGFIFLDLFSLERNILHLSLFTLAGAMVVVGLASLAARTKALALVAIAATASAMFYLYDAMFDSLFEMLHHKSEYTAGKRYKYLVQNRGGVIAVDASNPDIIYGGGMYDGRFSIDPVSNANGITRAYMIGALHPKPAEVLAIGLSSGSWAEVLTHHRDLQHLTVVEINPGYPELIAKYPVVSPLLRNPRVSVNIDDGRRWLNRHPDARFDLIVMNTTFHWRDGITNLLSLDFLRICKAHLKEGGVIYYNTTSSEDVVYTAAQLFRHVTLVDKFVAASDSPFPSDRAEIRQNLLKFRQNGVPDLARDAATIGVLEKLVAWNDGDRGDEMRRATNLLCITDDNMATEFKRNRQN